MDAYGILWYGKVCFDMMYQVLDAVVGSDPTIPANACAYNDKTVTNKPSTFRRCLYRSSLQIANWPEVHLHLHLHLTLILI